MHGPVPLLSEYEAAETGALPCVYTGGRARRRRSTTELSYTAARSSGVTGVTGGLDESAYLLQDIPFSQRHTSSPFTAVATHSRKSACEGLGVSSNRCSGVPLSL